MEKYIFKIHIFVENNFSKYRESASLGNEIVSKIDPGGCCFGGVAQFIIFGKGSLLTRRDSPAISNREHYSKK